MSNIILPTASEVDAVDESAFIWDDLLDGILTLEQGKAIKCITDQLDADDVLSLQSSGAAPHRFYEVDFPVVRRSHP